MNAFFIWLFWSIVYLPIPKGKTIEGHVNRGMRTRPPWWKFKPCVWLHPEWKYCDIYLADESTIMKRVTLTDVKCFVNTKGQIIGLQLSKDNLRNF